MNSIIGGSLTQGGDGMGFIADFAQAKTKDVVTEAVARGQRHWREAFGTDKEEDSKKPQPRPIRGGSYGRSMIAEPEAFKRLLQAMRSMAPGGWSDDRYEQTKHFTNIQYVVIHRMSEQLAQAEFEVVENDPSVPDPEEWKPAKGPEADALQRVLDTPNNDDSFGDLMYRWNQQMDLTGTALTWMVPNVLGQPYELYPIPTATAIPQPAINPDYPDGYYRIQPLYPYGPFSSYPTPSTAVGAPIPAQWMLRFKYPHPLLRYDGYSPLSGLRLQIDEVDAMDRSRWYSMKRTINPSAVLNFDEMEGSEPLPEAEIERIRAEFENTFQGPENSGQLFVATPGAKLEQWGMTPKEMEYHQSWEQLVSFVMAGFGITKEAAGMISDSSYSTLFATLKQLHLLTLEPKCARIAKHLTRHLACHFGPDLVVRIRCRRIDDHDVKRADVETLITGKAIKKNELRKELGLHPTAEPWGEEIAGEGQEEKMMEEQIAQGLVPGQPQPGKPPVQADAMQTADGKEKEPKEVGRSRPKPGPMGRGSLGPRKALSPLPNPALLRNGKALRISKKSLFDRIYEGLSNGNGFH